MLRRLLGNVSADFLVYWRAKLGATKSDAGMSMVECISSSLNPGISAVRSSLPGWSIPLLIFLTVSSIYFAALSGVTSSNDGSHYALVRALVDRRSFEIAPYLEFTEHQDYSLNGERRYSDRPPGTALLAAPLYALGTLSPAPNVPVPSSRQHQ